MPDSRLVTSLALRPDGTAALFGASDGTLTMWNLAGDAEVGSYQGHKKGASVVGATFVNGGTHVVTAGQDGTIHSWHVGTGARVASFFVEDDLAGDLRTMDCTTDGASLQLCVGCESGLVVPMTVTVPSHGGLVRHNFVTSRMSLVDSSLQREVSNRTE